MVKIVNVHIPDEFYDELKYHAILTNRTQKDFYRILLETGFEIYMKSRKKEEEEDEK